MHFKEIFMLNLYNEKNQHLPPNEHELSHDEILEKIQKLITKLGNQLLILGHHYQQDDIIRFAHYTGDSLQLAKEAAKNKEAKYIIFCGVHFMAETADMLTGPEQIVMLPDLRAGCSMADMAALPDIEAAWTFLTNSTEEKITPITYINCTAELKSFVGKHEGSICTSSNAKKMISWALNKSQKLLFFPDQHLGRNTCADMGIPLEDMVIYNPTLKNGGLTKEQVAKAKVILWYGYCSVHKGFLTSHIDQWRSTNAEVKIVVHPECSLDVHRSADFSGSTSAIIRYVEALPSGITVAIGTEINLVQRLAKKFEHLHIHSLSPYQCLCTTMYRIRPEWLLATLESIDCGSPINVIKVDEDTKKFAMLALDQMLRLS
jgi:quinolinate synthase